MSQTSSVVDLEDKRNKLAEPLPVFGYCQNCDTKMSLSGSLQRFRSPNCREKFGGRTGRLRKARSNAYQREFRRTKYKAEPKRMLKVICQKCKTTGYLVGYSVRNKETE